jgi:hypothetical protein
VTAEERNSGGAAIQLLNQVAAGYIVSAALNVALERGIVGKLIDLEMLLIPGGRERTAEEFASLFEPPASSWRASCLPNRHCA